MHSEQFKETIEQWVAIGDERAKNCVYEAPYSFVELIAAWADNGDERAKKCVYEDPYSFVELIAAWADNDDERAKKCVYEAPYSFVELIAAWADNGDEKAKERIYEECRSFKLQDIVCKWAFTGSGNLQAEEFVGEHVSSFKECVALWAGKGFKKAKELIYKNPRIFEKNVIELANHGDEKAVIIAFDELKYKDTEKISALALNGDKNAQQAIIQRYSDYSPELFANVVLFLAEQENADAINLIFSNYNRVVHYALKILQWATENASSKMERALNFIKNNPDILPQIENKLLQLEEDGDVAAREIVFLFVDNQECAKRIALRASEGNQEAIEIVYNNFNIDSFAETIIAFTKKEGTDALRAKEFVYQHPTQKNFSAQVIRWANNNDSRAVELIGQHPENAQFEVYINYWKRTKK